MGVNSRIGKVTSTAGAALVITWSSNEPTAAATQTISDGSSVTDAESGQAIQNINTILTTLLTDVAAIKAQLNAGE